VSQSLKLFAICTSSLLLLLLVIPASPQNKSDETSVQLSPAPYRLGERLTYNVSFSNIISAAHVELQVVARGPFFGRDGLQLRGHVETTGIVNAALLAMDNDYVTYVDPETGLPYRSQQIVHGPLRTSDTSNNFNSSGSYDLLSAVYRFRAMPLNEGYSYYLSVRENNEEYQTELRVTDRRQVKTSVGSFNTLVTEVRSKNNPRVNGYNLRIYFSDDERHIPVLITARLSAGEIRAELAGSEFVTPVAPPPGTPLIANPQRTQPITSELPVGHAADNGALEGLPFKVGEQLNYEIYVASVAVPAGTATYQVRSHSRYFDHDGLMFTVSAQTTPALQRLFFANDQISSYVDPKTLLPFRTEMNLTEGSRRIIQTLTLNQDYGSVTTDKGLKIEIPIGTHDLLSAFYVLRTFRLAPPKRNAISILVNNRPRTLIVTSLKRESIQLGSQTIPSIQVSLTTDDPQGDKYVLRAWISDDERRLPLRIAAMTKLGVLRADLAILPLVAQ